MFSLRMCISKKFKTKRNSEGTLVQQEAGDPRGMSMVTEGQQPAGNSPMAELWGLEEQGCGYKGALKNLYFCHGEIQTERGLTLTPIPDIWKRGGGTGETEKLGNPTQIRSHKWRGGVFGCGPRENLAPQGWQRIPVESSKTKPLLGIRDP